MARNWDWTVALSTTEEDAITLDIAPQDQKGFDNSVDAYIAAAKDHNKYLRTAVNATAVEANRVFEEDTERKLSTVTSQYTYGPRAVQIAVYRDFVNDDGTTDHNRVILNIDEPFSQFVNEALDGVFPESLDNDA